MAIIESRCGNCTLCVKSCPAEALFGTLWEAGMERSELFDKWKCYQKQVQIMVEQTGIKKDLCGKCFAVCARFFRNEEPIMKSKKGAVILVGELYIYIFNFPYFSGFYR